MAATERIIAERDRLTAWLVEDAANGRLFLEDPVTAVQIAVPGLELPDLTMPGRELMKLLLREHPRYEVGQFGDLTPVDPNVQMAKALLRDVATAAADQPDGYATLDSHTDRFVEDVAAGRYPDDVVERVLDGLYRALNRFRRPSSWPVVSVWGAAQELADHVAAHPDLEVRHGD